MERECAEHITHYDTSTSAKFQNLVGILEDQILQGSLQLVESSIPLAEALKGGLVFDDSVAWVFKCPTCEARFQLTRDYYHGGAIWRALSSSEDTYFDFFRKCRVLPHSESA